ncbi:hypothetical protein RI129_007806 [Pyrocoelia pectoralis]|uniref:Helix-turn-helix domain-containing protein n=1 Tax=Pyrocoelia pectoralis TaxID=417401 RepID=A0AAN7VE95_9COLE
MDTVIPFVSTHPFSYKVAAFNSLLRRMFAIPMSPNHFEQELNIIKQIAMNNGFVTSMHTPPAPPPIPATTNITSRYTYFI